MEKLSSIICHLSSNFDSMHGKLTGWDDTIVALATPPGVSAIGVVRLSGKKAIEIANSLFHAKDLYEQPSHSIHIGYLKEDETLLDEVVVSLFKSPRDRKSTRLN